MANKVCAVCNKEFTSTNEAELLCSACALNARLGTHLTHRCPWEEAHGADLVKAFFLTAKEALINPVAFFESVSMGQGMLKPFIYGYIIALFAAIVGLVFQQGIMMVMANIFSQGGMSGGFGPSPFANPALSIITMFLSLFFAAIAAVIQIFIASAIYHLCLMLFGCGERGFESTLRVFCYALTPALFCVVPVLGTFVGTIWQIALCIIGFKVINKTTYGRSAGAVLLPTIVCCGFAMLVAVAIGGAFFAAMSGGLK